MTSQIFRKLTSIVISFVLLGFTVQPAFAIDIPNFPTCPNPTGEVISSYADGIHGIAGSTLTYTGSDTVYKVDATRIVQCYCSPDKSGIQTNWWKASSLSPKQKADLIAAGWVYIPDGSVWGLDPSDWMAYNVSFSCNSQSTTTNTNNNSGSGSSSSSNSNSTSSSSSSTSIASIIPSILGFADTGRLLFWRRLFLFTGIFCMIAGLAVHFVRSVPRQPKKR